jgi:hypothetical protein
MVPDSSDDQLSTWLGSALRADLASDQVDVDALLTGSRRRARRLRSQRIGAAAVAAVLLVGVPAGLEVFRPGDEVGPSAAMLPSSAGRVSGHSRIPSSLAFTRAELPAGLAPVAESRSAGSLAQLPVVAGQDCSASTGAPLVGRKWSWSSAEAPGASVELVVTGWAPGSATAALTGLDGSGGACRWLEPQTAHAFTADHSDQSWSGRSASGSRAVVRVGDWIAGVEVADPADPASALPLAQKLARAEASRLAAGQ